MALKPVIPYVENIKKTEGFGYWLGTYGQIATQQLWNDNSIRLPNWYKSPDHLDELKRWLGKRVADCVGVDKYARWVEPDGSINYIKNKSTDFNEDMLYKEAIRLGLPHGPIETLPKIEGVSLGYPGHWGVYVVHNGKWVGWESRGGNYGVVQYEIGKRPSTNQWAFWYFNPFVDYGGNMVISKRGDKDSLSGNKNVESMQTGFLKLGIPMTNKGVSYGADGSWGQATSNGLGEFQKKYKLPISPDLYDVNCNSVMIMELTKLQTGVPQVEYDKLKTALNMSEQKVANLEQQIGVKNAEIANLKIQLNKVNVDIGKLSGDLYAAQNKIKELEVSLAAEKAKISGLTSQLSQKDAELKSVASSIKLLVNFSEKN